MKATYAALVFGLSCSSALPAPVVAAAPETVACPVAIGGIAKDDSNPPISFSLLGIDKLTHLEIIKPSENGFFAVLSEGEGSAGTVLEFQVESRRETTRVPVDQLLASLAWSTAVSTGSRLAGTVSPGHYKLVLTYVSGEAPSEGKAQRLCMAISETFEVVQGFKLLRFE